MPDEPTRRDPSTPAPGSEVDRPEASAPEVGDPKASAPDAPAAPQSGVTRRRALQVLAAGAAGAAALPAAGCGISSDLPSRESGGSGGATSGGAAGSAPGGRRGDPLAAGTPTDPDLIAPVVPWETVLTESELETLATLCDAILPADDRSPGAAELGAHDFIDEWVSAPYDGNREDLVLVRGGLVWLDIESDRRFGRPFRGLDAGQRAAILDDICYEPEAAPELGAAARFFDRVRDLTSTAFWTTDEGMADLGFVGNRPMARFDGPPREVLEKLGLA